MLHARRRKAGVLCFFAGHLPKGGLVLVLRICTVETFDAAGNGTDPPARVKRQNL